MWTSMHSAACNLRLMMAFLSKHLAVHRGTEPIARIREAERMRNAIRIVTDVWSRKGPWNSYCSGDSMVRLVESSATPDERASLMEIEITKEASSSWLRDYWEYLARLKTTKGDLDDEYEKYLARLKTTKGDLDNEYEKYLARLSTTRGNDESCGSGLDALFASLSGDKEEADRFVQYMTKLKGGRQLEARSPGEKGTNCELVRMYVYNVKDIVKKKRRNWWKYAKLRVQFLNSVSDRKKQLMQQLIDRVADDLRKVPGVRGEARSVECDSE
ncbi:hypothetical protein P5V15_013826 [Pogonomyrmex californicus]